MSEDEGRSNPYPEGTFKHWYWDNFIGPIVNPATIQLMVKEGQLQKVLENNWTLVTQLQSGQIVIQKQFSQTQVMEAGMKELKINANDVMQAGMKQIRNTAARELM